MTQEITVPNEELSRFFRLSIDMLAVAGFDGFFKRLNPSWERTLGWSEAELLARPYMESLKNRLSSSFGTVISWVMGLLAKVNRGRAPKVA